MFKFLIPLIMPLLTAALPSVSEEVAKSVEVFVEHNVQLSAYIVAGLWFLFHLLPSPIQKKVTAEDRPTV